MGGRVDILTSLAFTGAGPALFQNLETINVGPGATTVDIPLGVSFEQLGTLNLRSGTTRVRGGRANGARFNLDAGTSLEVLNRPFVIQDGTQFAGTGTVRVSVGGTLDLQAGETTEIPRVELASGGTITGPTNVAVTTLLDWRGGRMTGAGVTESRTQLDISTFDKGLSERTLAVRGTADWTAGDVALDNGAVFNVTGGGVLNVRTNSDFVRAAGADGVVFNEGEIRVDVLGDALRFPRNVRLVNSGAVVVSAGDVVINYAGESSGRFDIAQGSSVFFDAFNHVYELGSGARFQGAGVARLVNGRLLLSGDVEANNFQLAGGGYGGGTLRVTGRLLWSSGIMGEGGGMTRAEGSLEIIGNERKELRDHTLWNSGIATCGNGVTIVFDNAVLVNEPAGQFLVGETFFDAPFPNVGRISNEGAFDVQDLTAVARRVAFDNLGRVRVRSAGDLDLRGGGVSRGPYDLESGGAVVFRDGEFDWEAGTAFTGEGAARVVAPAVCRVNADVTATGIGFDGTIEGPGTLTVTRLLGWFGTARGAGRLVSTGDARIGQATLDTRQFENGGSAVISGTLALSNGASFINRNRVELSPANTSFEVTGTPTETFRNEGVFENLGGPVRTIRPPFTNAGIVRNREEVLRFAGGFSMSGEALLAVDVDAIVIIDGETFFGPATRFEGVSRIVVNPRVRNSGTAAPGMSAGTLTIDGDYIQETEGSLEIELAGLVPDTEHDVFVVTGDAQLGGTLEILLIDGFEPQVGDTFTIMTYGSHSGEFDRVLPPCGYEFAVHYNANDVTLEVTGVGVPTPGDLDGDCDIDLDDYRRVAPCIGGPDVDDPPQGCDPDDFAAADLDGDLDVDIADVGALFNVFAPS